VTSVCQDVEKSEHFGWDGKMVQFLIFFFKFKKDISVCYYFGGDFGLCTYLYSFIYE
jgi:hypothetical protein